MGYWHFGGVLYWPVQLVSCLVIVFKVLPHVQATFETGR